MRSVSICDVGPRDGLQNHARVLTPTVRAELVQRLAAAGLPRVEAASFVNPRRVPAMAGAEQLLAAIDRRDGVSYAALVLNERGYERLAACDVDEVHFAFASTETFNRRNQNATPAESLEIAARIVERAHADGRRVSITIGASFGCPFEGAVDASRILALAERALAGGADEIIFADTIGVGVPRQTRELVAGGLALGATVGVHLHNTRNTGYANALAAVEAGATILDASIGGLGGCPFAPAATGNIATEDLAYLLAGEGIETGIDLDALLAVNVWLAQILEEELPSLVGRAGVFSPVAGYASAAAGA